MKKILVIGGGFSGLASALGAARRLDELGISSSNISITIINLDGWHSIRVRNYEPDITNVRVSLAKILSSLRINLIIGDVNDVDLKHHSVTVSTPKGIQTLKYDRIILALGSILNRPQICGLFEHGYSIDTWNEAAAFGKHLDELKKQQEASEKSTVLIVGAGLTGIELACEMPERLTALGIRNGYIILADSNSNVGADMGEEAQAIILEALSSLGIEVLTDIQISSIDNNGAILNDGTRVDAKTVVWTAGMSANPLVLSLPVNHDDRGRVIVNTEMQVVDCEDAFAAGDIAAAPLGDGHYSVMSCQHARPMGRFAGHNAVNHLLGYEMLAMKIDEYVTCLDLGPWGALMTKGWDRRVVASGLAVKETKRSINSKRIYPPQTGNPRDMLDFGSPVIQPPPPVILESSSS